MSPKFARRYLSDGSFVEISFYPIEPDFWRPHGIRYRFAWIQSGRCRVLFDNHHGKRDHIHIDSKELPYEFVDLDVLNNDFEKCIQELWGKP
jgi:hypothetical protein